MWKATPTALTLLWKKFKPSADQSLYFSFAEILLMIIWRYNGKKADVLGFFIDSTRTFVLCLKPQNALQADHKFGILQKLPYLHDKVLIKIWKIVILIFDLSNFLHNWQNMSMIILSGCVIILQINTSQIDVLTPTIYENASLYHTPKKERK